MAEPLVTVDEIRAVLHQEQDVLDSVFLDHIRQVHSRLEIELGFSYERTPQVRWLSGTDDPELILPGPGADRTSAITVEEDGVELTRLVDYEIDADNPRYLIRLDSENRPRNWSSGRRNIRVEFVPARAPDALVAAERVEVVRAYRGAQTGYADRTGIDGETTIRYSHAFAKDTRDLIAALKKGDGIGIW